MVTSAGVLFALEILFDMFTMMQAFSVADISPVCIRACVDLRWVRVGPALRAACRDFRVVTEAGDVASMAMIGLRV